MYVYTILTEMETICETGQVIRIGCSLEPQEETGSARVRVRRRQPRRERKSKLERSLQQYEGKEIADVHVQFTYDQWCPVPQLRKHAILHFLIIHAHRIYMEAFQWCRGLSHSSWNHSQPPQPTFSFNLLLQTSVNSYCR